MHTEGVCGILFPGKGLHRCGKFEIPCFIQPNYVMLTDQKNYDQRAYRLKACRQNTSDVVDNLGSETRPCHCKGAGTVLVSDDTWSCDLLILMMHCLVIIIVCPILFKSLFHEKKIKKIKELVALLPDD